MIYISNFRLLLAIAKEKEGNDTSQDKCGPNTSANINAVNHWQYMENYTFTFTLVILNSAVNLIGCTEYFSLLSEAKRNDGSSSSLQNLANQQDRWFSSLYFQ
jgi:hypothetical protein